MLLIFFFFFSFNDPAPTEIYTLSLHDALPICRLERQSKLAPGRRWTGRVVAAVNRAEHPLPSARRGLCRSEEHTSELQSRFDLVCRLLLEKKKKKNMNISYDSINYYTVYS